MQARANPASTLFPLLLVAFLAGMSYWLELATRAPAGANDGKSRHDPDYIVKQFEVRRYDAQGKLQHTVVADQMRHYPDDDSTTVISPRITYHRVPPTTLSAREAQVSSKGEHVALFDDIRVTRGGLNGKPDTVLTTTRLDVWPDDEIAKSNVPVTIAQGQTNIQGSGLSANNKESIYILEGPVQGVFFRDAKARSLSAPPAVKPASKPKPKTNPKAKPAAKPKPPSNR